VGVAIVRELAKVGSPLIGVTSLAAGADQLFADRVVRAGGDLMVIVPARDYAASFSDKRDQAAFERFAALAQEVIWLPFEHSSEEAYWTAGRHVVDHSDVLLAVWDGERAGGLGGSADVVAYARSQGTQVNVIWPEGATRA
jgi:hypothetical protein